MKKELIDIFLNLGYDEDSIQKDGFNSDVMRNNSSFNRAIAEYKYDLLEKEDTITSMPDMSREDKEKYREYYSMLRVLLDGLVSTLDAKITRMERQSTDDK